MGDLFQSLVDESATITYAQRLWDFFRGLFSVAISQIFDRNYSAYSTFALPST
jgi:hypothetical protein